MKGNENHLDVPSHHVGNKLNVEHSVITGSNSEATELFTESVKRMLHVSDWGKITASALSNFQLTDPQGVEVFREAQKNDLFKIDIPGPSSPTGDGFDWVKVEMIKKIPNRVTMLVRPAVSPHQPNSDVAHFFESVATSTFQVFRRGRIVSAGVYGRNEVPNVHSENLVDKVRNTMVAVGAIFGASKIQWESLVHGILNDPA
jgi:hypothetical protein